MNVSLTPELDKFVAGKVKSGRYTSASEVVREALRLLEEHDLARSVQLDAVSAELRARLASADHAVSNEPVQVRQRLEQRSRDRHKRIS